MYVGRVTSRLTITILAQYRNTVQLHVPQRRQLFPALSNQVHSLRDYRYQLITGDVTSSHNSKLNSAFQHFQFCSSSTQPNDKEAWKSQNEQRNEDTGNHDQTETSTSKDAKAPDQIDESDFESELSKEELVKLVMEKEEVLEKKQKEFEQTKDKFLRSYAELQNVMERTKREAENSKKFAIQNFAKGLLDVADNLGRASSVVKEGFAKIDTSNDTAGAVPLLKTLLGGVEMTEKQLVEVFKKFGVEKYDPTDEQFDPHRHNAVFQVPDPTKPPGTVGVVLKAGYMLYDRVIRPAEVGVIQVVEKEAADQGSEA